MTRYNNNRFTPGNKGNLRLLLNKAFIRQYYNTFNNNQLVSNIYSEGDITDDTICGCIPPRANPVKQGWNDPSQSENTRIARSITGTLGGKITYGNFYKPVEINYLGGWNGQPGGLPRPLRNRF